MLLDLAKEYWPVTGGGGAMLGGVFGYLGTRRTAASRDMQTLVKGFTELTERLEHSERLCQEARRKCEEENAQVRQRLRLVEEHILRPDGKSMIVG